MNKWDALACIGYLDADLIEKAESYPSGKKKSLWLRWSAAAACIFLVFALPFALHRLPESPGEQVSGTGGPPHFTANGITYCISPYLAVEDELPDGFVSAGEVDVGGYTSCPYYLNPDLPEWAYVCQEVRTNGQIDSTGTLVSTEPHLAYARYVDARLRGKDLVLCNENYYISMWSAVSYGDAPDVSAAYYDSVESTYGIRMEGEAPEGFSPIGTAVFTGHDTIPRGTLASNRGAHEVYVDPEHPEIILIPAAWHTHTAAETHETLHTGFDVYVRYDCPLR